MRWWFGRCRPSSDAGHGQLESPRVEDVTALLTALDTGRLIEAFSHFLDSRAHTDLPSTVTALIDDVARRTSQLQDLGIAQLVECADAALATLIANDRRLCALCRSVGDRHLA